MQLFCYNMFRHKAFCVKFTATQLGPIKQQKVTVWLLWLTWFPTSWARWECLPPPLGWTRGSETGGRARASRCSCRDVSSAHLTKKKGPEHEKLSKTKLVPEDLGTVIIILHGVLHKTEAIDVTHVRVSVGPEKIEAADGLLQEHRDAFVFTTKWQVNQRSPDFMSTIVTLTLKAKQTFRATSFSMAESMTG